MNIYKKMKSLSYMLRHSTEPVFITIDGGWADVSTICTALNISKAELSYIVNSNGQKSFSFDPSETKIRANRGHTIEGVRISPDKVTPPRYLYYGAATHMLNDIWLDGIKPPDGMFVYLTSDFDEAAASARQYGDPAVLMIKAQEFFKNRNYLTQTETGHWAAKHIPPKYFYERYPQESLDVLRNLYKEIRKINSNVAYQLLESVQDPVEREFYSFVHAMNFDTGSGPLLEQYGHIPSWL